MPSKPFKVVGIDVGSTSSGVVVIENGKIVGASNVANEKLVDFIRVECSDCDYRLFVEDIRPYNMRITDGIIQTIKFLGQVEWRLNAWGVNFELIPRWQVKQWIFLQFRPLCEVEIMKNIARQNNLRTKKGIVWSKKQTATFVYVDDRIIQKAMRLHWKIDQRTKTSTYNLKDHSWQALGLASFGIALYKIFAP